MSSPRTLTMIALGAVLLAGCHKPAAGHAASGSGPATTAGGGANVAINEADLPHPRPGQWEMVSAGADQQTSNKLCVTDRPLDLGRMRTHCQSLVIQRTLAGGIVMDSQCNGGGVASKIHITAQGDFQTAYSTDTQISFSLHPGDTPHVSQTHTDYRYVGPCPPGEAAAADAAAKGGE